MSSGSEGWKFTFEAPGRVLATILADGTVVFDWAEIERAAKLFVPGAVNEQNVALAKLLLAALKS